MIQRSFRVSANADPRLPTFCVVNVTTADGNLADNLLKKLESTTLSAEGDICVSTSEGFALVRPRPESPVFNSPTAERELETISAITTKVPIDGVIFFYARKNLTTKTHEFELQRLMAQALKNQGIKTLLIAPTSAMLSRDTSIFSSAPNQNLIDGGFLASSDMLNPSCPFDFVAHSPNDTARALRMVVPSISNTETSPSIEASSILWELNSKLRKILGTDPNLTYAAAEEESVISVPGGLD